VPYSHLGLQASKHTVTNVCMFCAVLSSGPASIKTHGHKRVHVQCRTLMWACKHQNTRSQTRACSVPYSHVGLQASKRTVTNACMFCAVLSCGPASIKAHGHKRVHVQCRTLMWACKHQNTRSQTRACSVPYSHVGLQASKRTVTNACMFCAVLSCGPASIETHGHKCVHVLCRKHITWCLLAFSPTGTGTLLHVNGT